MLIRDFLSILLDDTLEDARLRHCWPSGALAFLGAEQAVADCRQAMTGSQITDNLRALLAEARVTSTQASGEPDEAFWFSRELYIEWIAKVVSVVLLTVRAEAILPPSREAAMEAARLIGLSGN
ncbi:hypothetical protein [Roseomonas marmotae]|uniref:TetR family transcriptional regulator n=1 Tax=Roseomonas marmotae TaxID=2768161 RepID=A0ABS3KC54_9PROT|nr:hypothetical protein [Roseomonas marmotae]MBO1075046.1 hypothetical protein [Roseomonas marmotae]QTI79921.1 hypothetical protein IAI58_03820 [Roseomonas marmotae]